MDTVNLYLWTSDFQGSTLKHLSQALHGLSGAALWKQCWSLSAAPPAVRTPAFSCRMDPGALLTALRGKTIGFVGDSLSGNLANAVTCAFSAVSPVKVPPDPLC